MTAVGRLTEQLLFITLREHTEIDDLPSVKEN